MSDPMMCQVDPLTFWTLRLRGESPRPCFCLAGLGTVVGRRLLLVGAVASLKEVIEQLLHLLRKHLMIMRHLAACGQAWSLATQTVNTRKLHDHPFDRAYCL